MHVCMYECMHVCVYACMHVCMYVCMRACVYACRLQLFVILFRCENMHKQHRTTQHSQSTSVGDCFKYPIRAQRIFSKSMHKDLQRASLRRQGSQGVFINTIYRYIHINIYIYVYICIHTYNVYVYGRGFSYPISAQRILWMQEIHRILIQIAIGQVLQLFQSDSHVFAVPSFLSKSCACQHALRVMVFPFNGALRSHLVRRLHGFFACASPRVFMSQCA